MLFSLVRNHLIALLMSSVLVSPVMAQTALALPVGDSQGVDLRQALAVLPGQTLRLERLPLGDSGSELVNAELRRLETGDTAPLLVLHSGNEVTQTRPAPRAHFTGQLAGDPNSSVFVAIDSQGSMRSIVRRGEEVFVGDMIAASSSPVSGASGAVARQSLSPRSRRVDTVADAPAEPFACGVDGHFIEQYRLPVSSALLQNLDDKSARSALRSAAAPEATRRADIIIETDYALYQRLGSSAAVHAYVIDLFGYVSAQYESEVGARLNLTQVNVYSTPTDPWSGTTTKALLDQLTAYWNASARSNQARHHVHLLSGKNAGGGIAFMGTLGSQNKSYAYGVSANINGEFSATNPKIVWDATVVAHELGHTFGSDHTHNYDNPYIGSIEGGSIDCCAVDFAGSQCAAAYGVLPGTNSVFGGTAGTGAGTIMSYCHTLSPGIPNISFNFGTKHTRGVNPWRVASVLQGSAQTYLPLDNVLQNFPLTILRQGTGSGAVRSAPAGIDCGSSCSASFISGTQVTLAAQAASGSSFSGWGGACSGTANSCSVSMNGASSVTANFSAVPAQRLLSLSKSGTGTGTVTSSPTGMSCAANCGFASSSFASNTAVTLVAQADSGSTFAGWSGACTGTGNCTIAAGTSSANVTASFYTSSTRPFVLNKAGSGTGSVSITPPGVTCDANCSRTWPVIANNVVVTLVAQASSGSTFTGWSGACTGSGNCTIAAGSTAVDVTASFNPSNGGGGGPLANNSLFVTQQYLDFLRRTPDSVGLDYWVSKLNAGTTTRAQVIESMMYSGEFRGRFGPLVRLYYAYFRRVPDYAGLMYWFDRMYPRSGTPTSLDQVSDAFALSGEFVNTYGPLNNAGFITRVYQNVLGRSPDAAGYAYWLGQLDVGMPRGQVMTSFSQSTENQNATANALLITMSYVGMLRRSPEPVGYAWWLTEVNAGRSSVLSLITAFLNSTEYAARF